MRIHNKYAFTLTELMISVSLIVAVIGISTSSWISLARSAARVKQSSIMHAELRSAFDRMSRDLIGSRSIDDAGPTYFKVTARRLGADTVVSYVFSDGELYQVDPTSRVIAENIASFAYVMYRDDGVTPTTTPADAWSVDIIVTAEKQLGNETIDDIYQARITLRNKSI